jgi:surface protein
MYKLFLFTIFLLSSATLGVAQYITIWKTDNFGSSGNNQITIPANGNNYTIVWEEVDNPANNGTATGSNQYTLTFPTAGTYQVSITQGSGSFDRIQFYNGGDKLKLLKITQWGDTKWSSMNRAYFGCANLTITAEDVPNLELVTDMYSMFDGCSALTTVPHITEWNLVNPVDMTYMFFQATSFNQPLDGWNVGTVTNMSYMFYGASSFNHPIENWDVRNVTSMYAMFDGAINFNQSIGKWSVSSVTNMNGIFHNTGIDCKNLGLSLIGLAANPLTPNNIVFGAFGRNYGRQAASALEFLRYTKGWTIVLIGNEVECAALEVSLTSFGAKYQDGKVKLQWATSSEKDHDYFEVQKSADALQWVTFAKIKGAGTGNSVQNYFTTDDSPISGTTYYRLKIVDVAGNEVYSFMRSVTIAVSENQYIYPNPATSSISLSGIPKGILKIYNILGQEVLQKQVVAENTEVSIDALPAGMYTITMDHGWRTKFIKKE